MAMTALNLYRDKRGSADVPRRVRAGGVSLGEWVARCRDDYWLGVLSIEHTRELEAVETWSWGATRPGTWRHAFDLLAEYSARRGTTVLTEEITFDGVDLQAWAAAQRHAYAEGRMHHSSIQWLEGLSDWDWDADTARWIQGVTAAKQYVAHRGSIDSADRDTRVGAFRLGHWIQRCREDHRAATLPAERLAALEALPGWSWKQPSMESWRDGMHALHRFISRTGHAAPPQGEVVDDFALGWWVTRRRRDYRAGTLSTERVAELEALPGWQWDPNEHRWQTGFAALTGYVGVQGHASPLRGERFDEYPVGDWVRAQRTAHVRGRLRPDRESRLESLPRWRWHDDR
ncbi:helicase associated domain-containing protein (plasmid) [Mycolicibacterium pallens]|uniref:Helicase associated domain-containing protein n=2 Tax=Mycolicibacterium pallens TaxID=370524 RepID=A0ABX8VX57_9MYCO|nr:helicase associated domain-containing protein [Mycolicibacterium pallens]